MQYALFPLVQLCWLRSISVPKVSATDGSPTSFSLQSTHQLDDVKVLS